MRAFFFRRNWRERILLLLVLLAGAVIWLSSSLGRLRDLRRDLAAADLDLESQGFWLAQQSDIDAKLQARIEQVRGGRSLTQAQFVQQWSDLLKKHGLVPNMSPATSQTVSPVAVHSIASTKLEKMELAKFLELTEDLATTLPLVNIDRLSIVPNRTNPRQLEIDLKLSALELLK